MSIEEHFPDKPLPLDNEYELWEPLRTTFKVV